MGAFFGVVSKNDCIADVFFGTDYHSHLGTRCGGVAAFDKEVGLQRKIHNLGNAPFRTKFEHIFNDIHGQSAIGIISDYDPQPLLIRSHLGVYAVCFVGVINNAEDLVKRYLKDGKGHFGVASGGTVNMTELLAALIDSKDNFAAGIEFARNEIEGTSSILILTEKGSMIVARDKMGRLPVLIGKRDDGFCVAFESFSYQKLGYKDYKELGSNEIVEVTCDEVKTLVTPKKEMRICSFLWTYYGYPTSTYEGVNVEVMRCKNGEILAENDEKKQNNLNIDYVCGVPDSGTPHAIGYANKSKIPFARPYIKYTPTWSRSFMPVEQVDRNRIAKMKQIPVKELIEGKNLLFVDDSIVRGTTSNQIVNMQGHL